MYIQDTGKHATIGDQICCVYKNGLKVEGIITYDYGKDDTVIMKIHTKDHKFYSFESNDIQDFQVIKEGPFHKIVENIEPTIKFSEDGPNTECTVKTNHQGDDYVEYKPFTYQFGESVSNVLERWCTTLNDECNARLLNEKKLAEAIIDVKQEIADLD